MRLLLQAPSYLPRLCQAIRPIEKWKDRAGRHCNVGTLLLQALWWISSSQVLDPGSQVLDPDSNAETFVPHGPSSDKGWRLKVYSTLQYLPVADAA